MKVKITIGKEETTALVVGYLKSIGIAIEADDVSWDTYGGGSCVVGKYQDVEFSTIPHKAEQQQPASAAEAA